MIHVNKKKSSSICEQNYVTLYHVMMNIFAITLNKNLYNICINIGFYVAQGTKKSFLKNKNNKQWYYY